MTRPGVRQESWQRIGGESPPRGMSSQPPRPRVMHEVSAREGSREAFTGETTGQVLSCETGLIPGCRSPSVEEKATSSHDVLACMGRTSRSRRPCARGEVLCAEPGRSHPCPDECAGPGLHALSPDNIGFCSYSRASYPVCRYRLAEPSIPDRDYPYRIFCDQLYSGGSF